MKRTRIKALIISYRMIPNSLFLDKIFIAAELRTTSLKHVHVIRTRYSGVRLNVHVLTSRTYNTLRDHATHMMNSYTYTYVADYNSKFKTFELN